MIKYIFLFLFLPTLAFAETFGNLDTTTNYSYFTANKAAWGKFVLGEAGTVTKLTGYVRATSGVYGKGLIYSHNAGTDQPGTLLGVTPATAPGTSVGWVDFTFDTPVALEAGTYWLGFTGSGSNFVYYEQSSISGARRWYDSDFQTYASPETTLSGGSATADKEVCIYATYTPSGGETPTARRRIILIQ